MVSRHDPLSRCVRWAWSLAPRVGRLNHEDWSGYLYPPKQLSRSRRQVEWREPSWSCKAFAFSFVRALPPRGSNQAAAYSGQQIQIRMAPSNFRSIFRGMIAGGSKMVLTTERRL